MSLVIPEKFQHILRVLNTNIDGRRKIAFAITAIKVKAVSGQGMQKRGDMGRECGPDPRCESRPGVFTVAHCSGDAWVGFL